MDEAVNHNKKSMKQVQWPMTFIDSLKDSDEKEMKFLKFL